MPRSPSAANPASRSTPSGPGTTTTSPGASSGPGGQDQGPPLPQAGVRRQRATARHHHRPGLGPVVAGQAHGESGVVGRQRARPHHHRVGRGPQPVGVGPRLRGGDPLRGAVGGRRLPVEGQRPPSASPGAARCAGGGSSPDPGPRPLPRRSRTRTSSPAACSRARPRPDTRGSGSTAPTSTRATPDARIACGAGRGAAGVVAGLQGHHQRPPARPLPGGRQGQRLGVRLARARRGRPGHDLSGGVEHQGADAGIGVRPGGDGQGDRLPHEPLFVHAGLRVPGRAAAAKRREPSFSHPDSHRRPRDLTGSAPWRGFAGCTAGRELHPALKKGLTREDSTGRRGHPPEVSGCGGRPCSRSPPRAWRAPSSRRPPPTPPTRC